MLTTGRVADFFRPVKGACFCEMLTSHTKHEWSNDGVNWVVPHYHPTASNNKFNGGSAPNWPVKKSPKATENLLENTDGVPRAIIVLSGWQPATL